MILIADLCQSLFELFRANLRSSNLRVEKTITNGMLGFRPTFTLKKSRHQSQRDLSILDSLSFTSIRAVENSGLKELQSSNKKSHPLFF